MHQVAKVLEFQFSISPSNEHPGQISFKMDWLDFLAVNETLKSLLQDHSSKASILQGTVYFMVELSHLYMTTGKTIVLTRWTFVSKVMSLLLNVIIILLLDSVTTYTYSISLFLDSFTIEELQKV